MRRREQTLIAAHFGFTRAELTALTFQEYLIYRGVWVEHHKQED